MNRKTANKRLGNVAEAIGRRPIDQTQVCTAYQRFRETGELPEQPRLAKEVVERALNGGEMLPPVTTDEGRAARLLQIIAIAEARAAQNLPAPAHGGRTPRRQLFHEAVQTFEPVRTAARVVIRILVAMGRDVADTEFVPSDLEVPDFGSLGLHLLGWPERFVKPAHASQMQRVMQQHAALRALPDRSDGWYREAATGLAAFLNEGQVPADERVRTFALTIGEMFAIHAHYFGRGGEELLAAYEAVATTTGAEREAALRQLGALQAKASGARE